MRRPGNWKWKLAILLGLSTAVAWAADKDTSPPKADNSKAGWLRWGRPTAPPKPPKKEVKEVKEEKKAPEVEPPKSQVDQASQVRKQEEAAMYRRLAVCDELNRIALETQDQELMRKANELVQRTMSAYSQRTAHLPTANVQFESDEKTLEKHLGAGTAVAPRQTGSPPYSYKGSDRSPQTAARGEVDE